MHRRAATIIPATLIPSHEPLANAWRKLDGLSSSSSGITSSPEVRVSSVSGYRSFEMARDAGIDITQDEIRATGEIPIKIYAESTLPAIVANPEVMTW